MSGSVHRIRDLLLTPGKQSIKSLNELDKGNAKVRIIAILFVDRLQSWSTIAG